ncbi:unnamed protein product, partial [Mesorhabditis spiculigera]
MRLALLLALFLKVYEASAKPNDLQALYNALFVSGNYTKELAPVSGDRAGQINLMIEMVYMRLVEINSENQQLSLVIELANYWNDDRLRWDPKDYSGIENLYISASMLWIPDYAPTDSQKFENVFPENQRNARVSWNGTIFYETIMFIIASCRLEMQDFPFDRQSCAIGLQNHHILKPMLTMESRISPTMDPSVYEGNSEWCFLNISSNLTGVPEELTMAGFVFVLHREPLFYVFVVIFPSFLLTTLANFGMFWSANIRENKLEKMGLGLASMMAMTVMLDLASQQIHKTAAFPLLGYYVIICTAIIALGCVSIALLSNGASRPMDRKPKHTFLARVEQYVFTRSFFAQLFFQGLNIVNLIYTLSHWKNYH